MRISENYGFYLPSSDADDLADISQISQNFEKVDEEMYPDQSFDPLSTKAQSGKAVAEGINNEIVKEIDSELSGIKGRTYQLFDKDNYDLLNFYYTSDEKKIINHNSGRAIVIPTSISQNSRYVAEALGNFADIYSNISSCFFMSFAEEPIAGATPIEVGTFKGQSATRIFSVLESTANANYLLFVINFKTSSNENTAMAEKVFQTMTVAQIDGGFPLPKPYYDFSALRLIPEITFSVSDNKATSANTTAGAGWSGSFDSGFVHTTGNSGAITVNFGTLPKREYLVEFDYTGKNDLFGFTAEIGGSYPVDVYNGTSHVMIGFITNDNSPLVLTPFSNYEGTVTNISCREISSDGTDEVTIPLDNFRYTDCANEITGFWNIAVGKNALEKNVNGSRNIALGKSSLSMLLSGTRNLAYGTYSLPQLKNGNSNIGIGADAGLYMQTAEESVLIGKAAGGKLNSSQKDIAIGRCALYGADKDTSAPSQNIAIGENAGYNVTTANQNILIGKNAGYNISSGWRNIVIGNNAIADKLNTSYDIILIGAATNIGVDGITKSTAIGFGAVATKSNQTVIGGNDNIETLVHGTLKTTSDGVTIDEVATKRDISSIATLSFKVVDVLPTEDIDTKSIYLVKTAAAEDNYYDEYIYVNDTKQVSRDTGESICSDITYVVQDMVVNVTGYDLFSGPSGNVYGLNAESQGVSWTIAPYQNEYTFNNLDEIKEAFPIGEYIITNVISVDPSFNSANFTLEGDVDFSHWEIIGTTQVQLDSKMDKFGAVTTSNTTKSLTLDANLTTITAPQSLTLGTGHGILTLQSEGNSIEIMAGNGNISLGVGFGYKAYYNAYEIATLNDINNAVGNIESALILLRGGNAS